MKLYRRILLLFMTVWLLGSADLSPRILADTTGTFVPDEVVVGFRPEHAAVNVTAALEAVAGHVIGSLPSLSAYRIRFDPGLSVADAIARLRRRPDVL